MELKLIQKNISIDDSEKNYDNTTTNKNSNIRNDKYNKYASVFSCDVTHAHVFRE